MIPIFSKFFLSLLREGKLTWNELINGEKCEFKFMILDQIKNLCLVIGTLN